MGGTIQPTTTLKPLTAEIIIDGCHQGVLLARGKILYLKNIQMLHIHTLLHKGEDYALGRQSIVGEFKRTYGCKSCLF